MSPSTRALPPRPLHQLLRGWALAWLFLAGLCWSWGTAQAAVPAASDELAHAVLALQAEAAAVPPAPEATLAVCRAPRAELAGLSDLLHEGADPDALPRTLVWTVPPQRQPLPLTPAGRSQAEAQPLLRPPTRLG